MKQRLKINISGHASVYPVFERKNSFPTKKDLRHKLIKINAKIDTIKKESEQYCFEMFPEDENLQKLFTNEWLQLQNRKITLLEFQKSTIEKKIQVKNTSERGFTMSNETKNKIRNSFNFIYHKYAKINKKANYKTNTSMEFYTFTLPDLYSCNYNPIQHDKIVMQQFNKLLENLRKNYNLSHYVWVSERQTGKRKKSGNPTNKLHFHCVFVWKNHSDKLEVQRINMYWLSLLEKVGFKTTIANPSTCKEYKLLSEKEKHALENYSATQLLQWDSFKTPLSTPLIYPFNFIDGVYTPPRKNYHLKFLLNPVDVRPISSLKELAKYMSKYVTKNNEKIYCRTFGRSQSISKNILHYTVDDTNTSFLDLLSTDNETIHSSFAFTRQIGVSSYEFYKIIFNEKIWQNKLYNQILYSLLNQNFDTDIGIRMGAPPNTSVHEFNTYIKNLNQHS